MSDRPRISVVVPFFDSERHLAACIDSLQAQEGVGGPFELIFINNGSTDDSPNIVARYPEITLLEEQTPGAYAARNKGLTRAHGSVIAFTDADCVVDHDWLHSILVGMEDPAVGILLGHCRYPSSASIALRLLAAYENAKTDFVTHHCAPAHHYAYANNMAVRASVFDEIGRFEEWKRAADSELAHRMVARRPDLEVAFRPSMRVTHMEFLHARDRVRRLFLYTQTNSKIETFRELGLTERIGVLAHMFRKRS